MVKKLSQVNYHIFSLFFISLTGLMFAKVTCNTCNKSVCCRNLIEMFVMPYNGSEIIKNDAEIIKNTGSNRFWIYIFCPNNLFPFAIMDDHRLYQTLTRSNNLYSGSSGVYSNNTCSTLKLPKNLSNLFN